MGSYAKALSAYGSQEQWIQRAFRIGHRYCAAQSFRFESQLDAAQRLRLLQASTHVPWLAAGAAGPGPEELL